MKWLAVILILVVGCGGSEPRVVDPLLQPYVDEFATAVGFPVASSVGFGSVAANGHGGECFPAKQLVVIDEKYRGRDSDDLRVLMFHELGHCELGIADHVNVMIGFCPFSIMHEDSVTFADCFMDDWENHISNLLQLSGR